MKPEFVLVDSVQKQLLIRIQSLKILKNATKIAKNSEIRKPSPNLVEGSGFPWPKIGCEIVIPAPSREISSNVARGPPMNFTQIKNSEKV